MRNISAKKLFLLDGIGALVSAIFLGVILVVLEDKIGMRKDILYMLAIIPVFFALYSFSCYYFLNKNWKRYLKGIAILNTLYCCLTIGLLFFYDHDLTVLGWIYFIVEILILFVLIRLELQVSSKE